MRMIFEGLGRGFKRFSLYERIQNDIIFSIEHTARGDTFRFSRGLGVKNHLASSVIHFPHSACIFLLGRFSNF